MLLVKNNISLSDLDKISKEIVQKIPKKRIILLYGELGAGKTQLTKNIAKHLKIRSNVFSPTFLISKSYKIDNLKKLFHYDFYRLSSTDDLTEIGFSEVISDKNNIIIIEWPDKIKNFDKFYKKYILDKECIKAKLSHSNNINLRNIKIQ